MNKKIKRRNKILLLIILVVVFVVLLLVFLFLRNTNPIEFYEKYKNIEYGTKYKYEDMIKNPVDAKITYPKFLATEVGNYELTFKTMVDGEEKEQVFKFKIEDTKVPKLSLYIKDKNVEVALNKEYDLTNNIYSLKDIDESVLNHKTQVSEKEYKELRSKIKKENEFINNRVIKTQSDFKESKVEKNMVFYTTNLNINKKGIYKVKLSVVDENYNLKEEEWNIKVVDSKKILNSGGTVTCNYDGDDLESTEAYETTVIENYQYNPYKIVSSYEIVTTMTFHEDYNTDDNKSSLVNALNEKYSAYSNEKGVVLTIENDGGSVYTKIKINMSEYDKKKDALKVLKSKNGTEVSMSSVLKDSKKFKYSCK